MIVGSKRDRQIGQGMSYESRIANISRGTTKRIGKIWVTNNVFNTRLRVEEYENIQK
jgi:hypothetical protein